MPESGDPRLCRHGEAASLFVFILHPHYHSRCSTVPPKVSNHNRHTSDGSIALNEPRGWKPATKSVPTNESGRKTSTKTAAITESRQVKRPHEDHTEDDSFKIPKLTHRNGLPGRPTAGAVEPKQRVTKPKAIINTVPSKRLNVYVVGTNEEGEMGLGAKGTATEYRRPRHNSNLETVGVVQLAAGGMHCVALTHDNRILTWGVNDLGALGRDTT